MKFTLISTGNTKLSKDGIVSINMPSALTCPGAGDCKKYCYACVGQQAMGNAKAFRMRNLQLWLNDPKGFEVLAMKEIHQSGRKIVRWHDSGDIQSEEYLMMMIRIAKTFPDVRFYAYTKSIHIVMSWLSCLPSNLKIIQSYGGIYDQHINTNHPVAGVFKDEKELDNQGYVNCSESDWLPATSAKRIGLIVHGCRKKNFN